MWEWSDYPDKSYFLDNPKYFKYIIKALANKTPIGVQHLGDIYHKGFGLAKIKPEGYLMLYRMEKE